MPTLDQLDRKLGRTIEQQMMRFESLEGRVACIECDGLGEIWHHLMKWEKRLNTLEKKLVILDKRNSRQKKRR